MRGNRMVRLGVALLCTVTVAAAGLPAWGQPPAGPGVMRQRCMERFKTLDKNQDGALTLEEFSAMPHRQGSPENLFKTRDRNSDGKLSAEEFCAGPKS